MSIACPDCGTVQQIPVLPPRGLARCIRCESALERTSGRSIDAALACSTATILLLIPANALPFLQVSMAGATRQSLLASGILVLLRQGWVLLAALLGAFGIVLPIVRFGLLTLALAMVRCGRRPPWLGRLFRWAASLDLWAMPDVFLLGCAVGYSRVVAFLPVHIGAGGWCFIAAAFLSMISHAALDRRTVWRAIAPEAAAPDGPALSCTACDLVLPLSAEGGRCPRCRARLSARKPDTLTRTAALVAAGYLLYVPANLFPMTDQLQLGHVQGHTIFSGIERLAGAHLWPLALLIFCTSIAIPLLKLVGLTWFLISVKRGSGRRLVVKTKLYRIIDAIGRWSNVDVFTIAVFAPLMQFGQLASVRAAPGAMAFIAVVVLTMIASRAFDPRRMWDAAPGDTATGKAQR